jgi:epoxyqueuosine reductase
VGLVYHPVTRLSESGSSGRSGAPRIARYAVGEDYHELMLDRLKALASAIDAWVGEELEARVYVDTGPVLERVFAARSGLGWIGKNTCLIDAEQGSYIFLGAMLTPLVLDFDEPEADHCGTCRACLDACPTRAFPEPYILDATRCIAYTTIEDPGPIPAELRAAHGDRVFGCDICQEVCPWNRPRGRRALTDPLGLRERLAPRPEWVHASLEWILNLDEEAWRVATRRSPIRRAKYRGLIRNALVVAGNSGAMELAPRIEALATGGDSLLAEHARWALERLAGNGASSQG